MTKSIVREKVNVEQLLIGMYVCDLDRPWLETPFPLQGFKLMSETDIIGLQKHCDYVFIDLLQSDKHISSAIKQQSETDFFLNDKIEIYQVDYLDTRTMEQELDAASASITAFSQNTEKLLANLKQGQSLNLNKFKTSAKQMIDSVVRNPDAALWLVRLKKNDDYLFMHSLRCSVLAIAFGRQLGLTKHALNNLAVGAALLDIGKLKLPKSLLNQPRSLNEDEFEIIRDHVRQSVKMISTDSFNAKIIIEMIATHHERINGKGYPNGLKGDEIPLFGRIAAIVDCYDAISTDRPYAKALSPATAAKNLYEWKGIDFHPALVEVFIQALGIYPAGSLVELSNGQVGVVMSEYRARRLRPKIMLILDCNKKIYDEFPTIDLFKDNSGNISIKQSLEPGSYDIDPSELFLG
jgi:HD-GYP domain-containing protein (c-di-GMP phosphodiesterase class II)